MSDLDAIQDMAGGDKSRYFSFNTTPSLQGFFVKVRKEQDRFGPPGTTVARYYFVTEKGEEKEFGSKSARLAKNLIKADVHAGDLVKISRAGTGYDTNYIVEVLDRKGVEKEEEKSSVFDEEKKGEIPSDLSDMEIPDIA